MTYHIRSAITRVISTIVALAVAAIAAFCLNWLVSKVDSSQSNKSRLSLEDVEHTLPQQDDESASLLKKVVF